MKQQLEHHEVVGVSGTSSDPVVASLTDYEALARNRADAQVWDFLAGGAEDEVTLRANIGAFRAWSLRPRVLRGVGALDLSVELVGTRLPLPILLAPVGYQGLFHPDAEIATARGALEAGALAIASAMSNVTLEAIAQVGGPRWFQLYVLADREVTTGLICRAEDAGYSALVITVDAPILGRRERDLRNGFVLPEHLRPANLPTKMHDELHVSHTGRSAVSAHTQRWFDSALDWKTIEWVQRQTRLPIVLKGVMTREDARLAKELGACGLVVSNHGGRQLDGAPASLDVLEEVVSVAGPHCDVMLDGGVRRGTDILKARALGARAVLLGRPFVWGLLADGATGVARVVQHLVAELEHAMRLSGCARWSEIDRSIVTAARTS